MTKPLKTRSRNQPQAECRQPDRTRRARAGTPSRNHRSRTDPSRTPRPAQAEGLSEARSPRQGRPWPANPEQPPAGPPEASQHTPTAPAKQHQPPAERRGARHPEAAGGIQWRSNTTTKPNFFPVTGCSFWRCRCRCLGRVLCLAPFLLETPAETLP